MACSQLPMKFLSPTNLHQIFTENICEVTTIDVRPYSDFVVGHIAGAFSVRLSSLLIRRLGQGKITFIDIVADEQKDRFRSWTAGNRKRVVVYDESVSELDMASTDPKNPLFVVTRALLQTYPEVAVLQGGFSAFKAIAPEAIETADDETPSPLLKHCACESSSEQSPVDKHVRDLCPSEILPYLFVGSQQHAQSKQILEQLQITHILNITATCPNWYPGAIQYRNIQIKDTWNQNISSYFEDSFAFIDSAKQSGGHVLVHCVAGISRSPTIVIAYLMRTLNISLQEALTHVKGKRAIVSPNLDFLVELEQYERVLNPALGPAPLVSPDPPDTAAPFAANMTGTAAMDTGSECASDANATSHARQPHTPFFPSTPAFGFEMNFAPTALGAHCLTPPGLGHAFSAFGLSSPSFASHSMGAHHTAALLHPANLGPWSLLSPSVHTTLPSETAAVPWLQSDAPNRLRSSYSPHGSPRSSPYTLRRDASPRAARREQSCAVSPVSPAHGIFAL